MSDLESLIARLRHAIFCLTHHRHHPPHHHKCNPSRITNLKARLNPMSTATLTWTLPTTRTDGAALAPTEIASVDIFDSGSATPASAIGNAPGAAVTFTTDVLSVGDHGFTVVVNDTTGHKSLPSNVASVSVAATLANPNAVTDLAAVLNP